MKKLFNEDIFDDLVYSTAVEDLGEFIFKLEMALEYVETYSQMEDDYKTILDIIERTKELKEEVEKEQEKALDEDDICDDDLPFGMYRPSL